MSVRNGTHIIPALLISKCKGLSEVKNFSANASMESGFIKSISSNSTFGIPCSFCFALSRSLAGTITVAPALASVLTVSNPIPVLPPVTMATFPVKSIPLITSVEVEFALKPDSTGFCNAPLKLPCPIFVKFAC